MKKLAILFGAMIAFSAAPANAEVTACQEVTALPFVINASGVWCLKKNLSKNKLKGNAILIRKNNVVLDLNGFRLFGGAGAASVTSGIRTINKSNIVIRNGTIEGFYRGIYLQNENGSSSDHLVEDIHATENHFAGMQVEGENLLVRNNHVTGTGPSDEGSTIQANGILVTSFKNARVWDNTVSDTSEQQTARGIFAITGTELVVERNVVTDTNTATATFAIHVQSVTRASVIENQLLNAVAGTTGIRGVSTTGLLCINNVIDVFNNTTSVCNFEVGTLP